MLLFCYKMLFVLLYQNFYYLRRRNDVIYKNYDKAGVERKRFYRRARSGGY